MRVACSGNLRGQSDRSQGASEANKMPEINLAFEDYAKLVARKQELLRPTEKAKSELRVLTEQADADLEKELVSVVQKTRVAPSGDPHDYLSLAPYWWPDPKTADGLPYIRHAGDGKVNPSARGATLTLSGEECILLTGFID